VQKYELVGGFEPAVIADWDVQATGVPVASAILHVRVPEAVDGTAPAGVTQLRPVRIPVPVAQEYVVTGVARIVEGVAVTQRLVPTVAVLRVVPVGQE